MVWCSVKVTVLYWKSLVFQVARRCFETVYSYQRPHTLQFSASTMAFEPRKLTIYPGFWNYFRPRKVLQHQIFLQIHLYQHLSPLPCGLPWILLVNLKRIVTSAETCKWIIVLFCTNMMHNSLFLIHLLHSSHSCTFMYTFLYIFRTLLCSSSGRQIVYSSIWFHHSRNKWVVQITKIYSLLLDHSRLSR
jgi:hypothetical protein